MKNHNETGRKPKILLTASTFPRWAGDTEPRFILDLAKAYLKYYDVTVLAPAAPGSETDEIMEGVHVVRYHYFPVHRFETLCAPGAIVLRIKEKKLRVLLVPFLLHALKRSLKKMLPDFDYVHAHWIIPQGMLQSGFDKKYILTGHGGDVVSMDNIGFLHKRKVRAVKRAERFIVVSEALADYAQEHFSCERPAVISMGCDTSMFGPEHRKENFFGQNGRTVVLFVGRLVEIKGVKYLIDAVKGTDALLVIAGAGPLEAELKARALSFGENNVVFLGSKTHEELKTVYASADIFAAPSVTLDNGEKEGLGLVLLEAMASGLPVIGSDSGGIPEIVHDGVNGLLVPEKDAEKLKAAIQTLAGDAGMRQKMAKAGMAVAESRDYSAIAEKYHELIGTEQT